ncbi:MAG: hypothetical protein V3U76_14035 [Granulosicoccus sp.]
MIIALYKKLFVSGVWNIGYTNQSIDELFENTGLSKVNWLPEDTAGDYSADPFIFIHNGVEYIGYEHLDFTKGKGRNFIVNLKEGFSKKRIMSYSEELTCHQSYPYIFEDQGVLYCIPETSELTQVKLFRCGGTPYDWVECATLLKNFPGVDSSIVFIDDMYWLFTTPIHDQTILNLHYARSIEGPYKAHTLNPIVKSTHARMAGIIFQHKNHWYRPAQDLSSKYGGAIILKKIELINDSAYRESSTLTLHPQEPYSDGLHTISIGNNKIIVDGRRKKTSISTPFRKIIRRLHT